MFYGTINCQKLLGKLLFLSLIFLYIPCLVQAQTAVNLDEANVGTLALPSLLATESGKTVKTAGEWEREQRPVILQKFAEHVYGRMPARPKGLWFRTVATDPRALQGKATRKEVVIHFSKDVNGPSMHLLLYLPNAGKEKVPVLVGLNFQGNHSVQQDTGITITAAWKAQHTGDTATKRGGQESRWPVAAIIDSGFGLATAWYQDLEVDNAEGWKSSIRTTLQQALAIRPEEWGAIGAWGWGLSRIMDYLETDKRVNPKQVVITGHSRLGKAALWAAANDQRFAIVVSNNSGEGGAALARRNFGETVERINTVFPHWFVGRYKTYNQAVESLPVDQHMLLALMAPRPLYVASASEDLWADPKGEFLSAREAGKVYALYKRQGIAQSEPPPVNTPVGKVVRYHLRQGGHDMLLYDWQQYIVFAREFFRKK
jgi:hypothetical protein